MSLDMYIERVKNLHSPNEEREDICYWRKNWALLNGVKCLEDYDRGKTRPLSKDDLREILEFVVYHPDYWGDFDSVPSVCRLFYNYDDLREQGYTIVFYAE